MQQRSSAQLGDEIVRDGLQRRIQLELAATNRRV
jgi:hypothetical protein